VNIQRKPQCARRARSAWGCTSRAQPTDRVCIDAHVELPRDFRSAATTCGSLSSWEGTGAPRQAARPVCRTLDWLLGDVGSGEADGSGGRLRGVRTGVFVSRVLPPSGFGMGAYFQRIFHIFQQSEIRASVHCSVDRKILCKETPTTISLTSYLRFLQAP